MAHIPLVARRKLQVSRLQSVGTDVVTAAYSQGNTRGSESLAHDLQLYFRYESVYRFNLQATPRVVGRVAQSV